MSQHPFFGGDSGTGGTRNGSRIGFVQQRAELLFEVSHAGGQCLVADAALAAELAILLDCGDNIVNSTLHIVDHFRFGLWSVVSDWFNHCLNACGDHKQLRQQGF